MILNPPSRVRILSGGQYTMRLRSLHRAYPSLHRFRVVHWVPEQLNIKAVTGACKLIDGCSLALCWPQVQWYQLAYATEMKSIQLHDSIEGLSQKIVSFTIQYNTIHTCQTQFLHIIPNLFKPGLPWPPSWPCTLHLHIHPRPILLILPLHMTKPPQLFSLQNNTKPAERLRLVEIPSRIVDYILVQCTCKFCVTYLLTYLYAHPIPRLCTTFLLSQRGTTHPPNHSHLCPLQQRITPLLHWPCLTSIHHAASDTAPIDFNNNNNNNNNTNLLLIHTLD